MTYDTVKMETYNYEPIKTDVEEIQHNKKTKSSWIPLLRQLFICMGVWSTMFACGLGVGAATVLIVQWRREGKSEDVISEEMSSWITCTSFLSAPIFAVIYTTMTKFIGRRIPYALSFTIMLIGFIVFYNAKTLTHLLISEIFKGSGYASILSLTMLVVTEYTSPKYRGVFLTVKSASIHWGIWVANAIGTFFHWRYIGTAAFVCLAYSASIVFWPESPLWLATKGRFEESAASHRWLKGTGQDSERELKNMIETQKEKLRNAKKIPLKMQLQNFLKMITRSYFYKPLLISLLVHFQYLFSGKVTIVLYAMELLKKMTTQESSAYTVMLILDGVTVCCMYCGCLISRYVKRRNHVMCTSMTTVIFLFLICLYFYLVDLKVIVQNNIILGVLLIVYTIGIACGPMAMCYTIYGELMPTESRTTYAVVGVLINATFSIAYIKTAPYVFNRLSITLSFLIYAVSTTLATIIIYIYLPETKDKTLVEIENYFRKTKPVKKRDSKIDDVE